METIQEAKKFLNENYKKGVECPCCRQFVKLYVRPMHSTMAACLISLYKLSKEKRADYFHLTDIIRGISAGWGDFAKLSHWELVEEKPIDSNSEEKRTSGYWKITPKGEQFVLDQITVPQRVHIYNGKVKGFSGPEVSIIDVLKKKFNYSELMGSHV